MNSRLEVVSKRYQLMLVTKEKYIWYYNGGVYVSTTLDQADIHRVQKIYQSDATVKGRIKSLFVHSRIAQRIARLQPRAVSFSETGTLCFAYDRKIIYWDMKNNIWKNYSIRSEMRNPLCIVYLYGIEGFSDAFVYGEYGWNDNRDEVRIRQFNGDSWVTIYTFPSKTICHVHAIIPDKENKCVYILTGDENSESGIWKATDNFTKVEPYVIGSQQYRSCAAMLQDDHILFATDTPIEDNYLYSLGKDKKLTRITEMPGPVINHLHINHEWWLATTVEQDPNLPHWEHCISCRRAPGIKDRYVHIFYIKKNGKMCEVASLQKDIMPMWLFQFGNTSFVENRRDDRVFIVPMAVKKYNQQTIEIVIEG